MILYISARYNLQSHWQDSEETHGKVCESYGLPFFLSQLNLTKVLLCCHEFSVSKLGLSGVVPASVFAPFIPQNFGDDSHHRFDPKVVKLAKSPLLLVKQKPLVAKSTWWPSETSIFLDNSKFCWSNLRILHLVPVKSPFFLSPVRRDYAGCAIACLLADAGTVEVRSKGWMWVPPS